MANLLQDVRIELYRKAYERELERRREGLDRLSGLIIAYTLVGGILAFYVSDFPEPRVSIWHGVFFGLIFSGLLSAAIGFVLLARSIWRGKFYTVLNTPEEIDKPLLAAIEEGSITPENESAYAEEFNRLLLGQYRDFATINQNANNSREITYNWVLKYATFSIAMLALAAPFQLIIKTREEKMPDRIKIVDPIKIMPNDPSIPKTPPALPVQPSGSIQNPKSSEGPVIPVNFVKPINLKLPGGLVINASASDGPAAPHRNIPPAVRPKLELPEGIRINEAVNAPRTPRATSAPTTPPKKGAG